MEVANRGGRRLETTVMLFALAVFAGLLVTLRFAPRINYWPGLYITGAMPDPEFDRALSSLAQLEHPWAPIDAPFHKVIRWRLLLPLVWHFAGLPSWLYLLMPQVGCVLTLWLVATLAFERSANWWWTGFVTVLFAALPWFFVSSGWLTYFDSWCVLGLLTASFVPSRVLLAIACLVTPWVDERFVLALPVIAVTRFAAFDQPQELAILVVASLPYPAIRAVAYLAGEREAADYFLNHWRLARAVSPWRYAEGLWSGFRGGWVLIVATIVLSFRANRRWGILFAAVTVLTATASLFIAWDMSRTLMILTPIFLLSIWNCAPVRWLVPAVTIFNLVCPAEHVIWMTKWPIQPAWTVMHEGMPASLRSAQLLNESQTLADSRAVLEKLDEAVALDPRNVLPLLNRALVYINLGRLPDAKADVDQAIALQPNNSDVLYLRGILLWQSGDEPAAREYLKRSLELAPPTWQRAEQVKRLLAS